MKKYIVKQEGFIAVFWLSLFIIVLVAFNTTVLYNLVNQQITMTKQRERLSQNYLYSELGAGRGLWLIKEGGVSPPAAPSSYDAYLYIDQTTKAVSIVDDASQDIRVLVSMYCFGTPINYVVQSPTTGEYATSVGGYRGIWMKCTYDASHSMYDIEYQAITGYGGP